MNWITALFLTRSPSSINHLSYFSFYLVIFLQKTPKFIYWLSRARVVRSATEVNRFTRGLLFRWHFFNQPLFLPTKTTFDSVNSSHKITAVLRHTDAYSLLLAHLLTTHLFRREYINWIEKIKSFTDQPCWALLADYQ